MAEESISTGFTRQRRSLLASSIILLFFQMAGVTLESLNIFGNEVILTDPWVVEVALWIAWFYFTIRYLQHFHDLEDRGLVASFNRRMQKLVPPLAVRLLDRAVNNEFRDASSIEIGIKDLKVMKSYADHWEVQVNAGIAYKREDGATVSISRDRLVTVPRVTLWVPRIQSVLHVVFLTRLGTEYVLPLLVAILPLAWKLYRLTAEAVS